MNIEWPIENGNPAGREDVTGEFSFILKSCPYNVGVFAAHRIKKGTKLELFDGESQRVKAEEVPGEFIKYCFDDGDGYVIRPENFNRLDCGWFLNHSKNPNANHDDNYDYFSSRDIEAGEEILINYGTLV